MHKANVVTNTSHSLERDCAPAMATDLPGGGKQPQGGQQLISLI